MSASAAQLQFAAEFVSFLAAAAGLGLVARRATIPQASRWTRPALSVAFLALASAAFLHGSLLVRRAGPVSAVRGVGVLLLLVGSVSWPSARVPRDLIRGGGALVVAATVLAAAGAGNAAAVVLAAAALAVGSTVVLVSRSAISARVAASAAVTLLLVILVLSVLLSAVVVRTVEREEVRRLKGRAQSEAQAVQTSYVAQLITAKVVAGSLAGSLANQLAQPDAAGAAKALGDALNQVGQQFYQGTQLVLVSPTADGGRRVLATTAVESNAVAVGLAGSEVVKEALTKAASPGAVQIVAGRAMSVGTAHITAKVGNAVRLLGVVVAASNLDATYLQTRASDDPVLALEIVGRNGVLSKHGAQPPTPAFPSLVAAAIDDGRISTRTIGNRFVVVAPVRAGVSELPVLSLVVSTPTGVVSASRDSLFRTLFLIALGGTLLALLLAAIVGERIGAGLRRLTTAAESIEQGDLSVRAAVDSTDEVGRLGAAFDSMAGSIQEKTLDEARLRNRLEAVVAGMGEALVAVDAAGHITDFNEAAEELIGLSAADARGSSVAAVIALQGEDGADLSRRLAAPTAKQWTAEALVRHRDGTLVPVAVLGGALHGPADEHAGSVFVLRDVRREREVEQMKTEFLSRIGHELRTPLTAIMGYADLLSRKTVPVDRARAWHGEILKQSRSLFRIVQMLEFFASSGAGRVKVRPEEVDVRTLIDDVTKRWATKVDGTQKVARRVARGVPKTVFADRQWLTLSLDELIDNAVKFSPPGAKVEITARPAANGRRRATGVELIVTDRGKGMSDEETRVAFADFSQGDSSDTRSFGGLGLGLSLVQRVTEAHGGTVAVESKPGKGSKFSIFLPSMPKRRVR